MVDTTPVTRPLVAVVLAGGVGTRLYPASRPEQPKQFRSFTGGQSLLARTVERTDVADETYVLTRAEYVDEVHEHASSAGVLVEPEPKDTGPALVYAAHRLRELHDDPVLLVLPSDHHVAGDAGDSTRLAASVAVETGGLVTLGVEPSRAATEYGYIEPGPDHGDYREVERFHEKPDPDTAARYREQGYRWNAGIFAWTPDALLSAARETDLEPLVEALDDGDPDRGFAAVDPVSVDHAVMERAEDVYVVPVDFEWDDLGAWDAVERVVDDAATDADGNVILGDALTLDASRCVIATGSEREATGDTDRECQANGEPHVSVVGVEDLVIAAYGDRVLVVPKRASQRVREVVERLRDRGRFGDGTGTRTGSDE